VVGTPRYFADGGVEVDVEVPLEGALSEVPSPKPDTTPGSAAPAPPAAAGKESP
jgi:hypothetical protein